MAVLLITYDLNNPGQKYRKVHEAIHAVSDVEPCHVLESTWLIRTDKTPGTISNHVRQAGMDDGDHILVVNVSASSHQGWVEDDAIEWANRYWR